MRPHSIESVPNGYRLRLQTFNFGVSSYHQPFDWAPDRVLRNVHREVLSVRLRVQPPAIIFTKHEAKWAVWL